MQIGKGLFLLLILGLALLLTLAYFGGAFLSDYEYPYAEVIPIPDIQAVLEPSYKPCQRRVQPQVEYAETELSLIHI